MKRPERTKKRIFPLGKKLSPLVALCILTALALLLSGGAVTLAKYIMETRREGAAVAKPFYFSSDKLQEDGPYYQTDSVGGDQVKISFQLRNYVDKLRCTDTNFSCSYAVTTASGEELFSGTKSFSGGSPKDEQVEVTVDSSYFANGSEVTVTAATKTPDAPYDKTISARFGFAKGGAQLQYSVTRQDRAVVLEIGGAEGNVTVAWPNTLTPDKSNSMLDGAEGNSVTFAAESSTRYAFTFLMTNDALTYDKEDFTVTLSGS